MENGMQMTLPLPRAPCSRECYQEVLPSSCDNSVAGLQPRNPHVTLVFLELKRNLIEKCH